MTTKASSHTPKNSRKIAIIAATLALAAGIAWANHHPPLQIVPPVFTYITSQNVDGLRDALAKKPAAVREIDLDGNTALHEAAAIGNADMVNVILKSGANPNVVNARGETPLYSALTSPRNSLRMVQLLLKAGADPSQKLAHSASILHLAARIPSVNSQALALLIKQPDQLATPDDTGKTPVQIAKDINNTRFLATLK